MKRRAIALFLILMLLCAACTPQPQKNSISGFYFDTVVTITAYAPQSVLEAALALCAEYEALLSKTRDTSDVYRINHANGEAVAVSEAAITILHIANEISKRSGGAFDVTVAPAVALWDFTGESAVLPDDAALRNAVSHIGYQHITIHDDRVTIPKGAELDLGGVAKGYIADEIAAYLTDQGVSSFLLNFGGNVIACGIKPDGSKWNIGIQDPAKPSGAYLITLEASHSAVVTSGTYERGFDLNGVRYHHILDPNTGWPVQNGLISVSIIAERSVYADALSTACFVMGEADGLALIEDMPQTEAVFLYEDGTMHCSSGFKDAEF